MKHNQFRYVCLSSFVFLPKTDEETESGSKIADAREKEQRREAMKYTANSVRGMDFEKRMLLASMIATLLQKLKYRRVKSVDNYPAVLESEMQDTLIDWNSQLSIYHL